MRLSYTLALGLTATALVAPLSAQAQVVYTHSGGSGFLANAHPADVYNINTDITDNSNYALYLNTTGNKTVNITGSTIDAVGGVATGGGTRPTDVILNITNTDILTGGAAAVELSLSDGYVTSTIVSSTFNSAVVLGSHGNTATITNSVFDGHVAFAGGNSNVSATDNTFHAIIYGDVGVDRFDIKGGSINGIDTSSGDDVVNIDGAHMGGAINGGIGTNTLNIVSSNTLTVDATIEMFDVVLQNSGTVLTVDADPNTGFDNNLMGDITINNNTTLDVVRGFVTQNNIDVKTGGTLISREGGALAADSFTFGTNSNYVVYADKFGDSGSITSDGANLNMTGVKITPVLVAGYDRVSRTYVIADNNGLTPTYDLSTGLAKTRQGDYTFSLQQGGLASWGGSYSSDQLVLVVTLSPGGPVYSFVPRESAGFNTALDVLSNTATSDTQVSAFQTEFNALAGAQQQMAAETLLPGVETAVADAAVSINTQAQGVTSERLALMRNGASGIATGDAALGRGMWAQGFGRTSDQEGRKGREGYNANTAGITFGADTDMLVKDAIVGGAFTYAHANIDSDAAGNAQVKMDSFNLSGYGTKALGDGLFVNGQAGVGYNTYDGTRTITAGGFTTAAKSDYDAVQVTAKAEVGKDLDVRGATVTPLASLGVNHLNYGKYTETGAGGLGLAVDPNDFTGVQASVGAKVSKDFALAALPNMIVTPDVSVKAIYDLGDTRAETTSAFANGGGSFSTEGILLGRAGGQLGAGVTFTDKDSAAEFGARYDGEFRDRHASHAATLNVRVKF